MTHGPSRLSGILQARCPRCREGRLFGGSMFRLAPMQRQCEVCGLKYEREPGYFLGAMYISYFLAIPIIGAFALLFWWLTSWSFATLLIVAAVTFVPFAPLVTRFSRVVWIYIDRAIDPD